MRDLIAPGCERRLMADVLITAESQAQINADGTRSCIHLPNVEAEAEHIRAAFGNRADKHSRISVGRPSS